MSYRDDSLDERATFLDEEKCKKTTTTRGLSLTSYTLLTVCNAVFFFATLSLYASSWIQQGKVRNPKLRQTHSYCKWLLKTISINKSLILLAPILDAVDIPLEVKTLNGTLYANRHPSVARGPPSPEKDAIWDEWELTRVYPITADQIRAMGKDPSTATKLEVALLHPTH